MANNYVVYHSGYGHTKHLAQSVAKGAQAELIEIDQDGNISDADWIKLDNADAIIFGSPTYIGMVSWQFKKFADASSKRWFSESWKNKVAGGFTTSNSPSGDKFSTINWLITFAMQHGMLWVSQAVMNDGSLNRLGAFGGVMAQVPAQSPASDMHQGDLDSGFMYGKRVAAIAAQHTVQHKVQQRVQQ